MPPSPLPPQGTKLQNKKTGTQAVVVDITPNGLVWLSNGATWPEESFWNHWQLCPAEAPNEQPHK